jgi:hypothetical protein
LRVKALNPLEVRRGRLAVKQPCRGGSRERNLERLTPDAQNIRRVGHRARLSLVYSKEGREPRMTAEEKETRQKAA